jgi:hypothetical protein
MTHSITTLSITIKDATLYITALDTVMLSVKNKHNKLSVIIQSVVILTVVAPTKKAFITIFAEN